MKILGVIHLKGLPGSTSNSLQLDEIIKLAQNDIDTLTEGGVHGIIIENFGDAPFVKDNLSKRSLVSFTTVVSKLDIDQKLEIGINVLRNDGLSALAIAEATNADFVRINVLNNIMYTDQGIIEGKAYEISQLRSTLNKNIKIFADVFVKHATPPYGSKIENIVPEGKLAIGSGLTVENIEEFSKISDIGIIGTDFKVDGVLDNPVELKRVKDIVSKIS